MCAGIVFDMVPQQNATLGEQADVFARRHVIAARERAEQKERDRAEACADWNAPAQRIRAWEKLCGLRLPSDPEHPVLMVVAASTRLTLAQVREHQRERRTRT
jgi:hypothetical protein